MSGERKLSLTYRAAGVDIDAGDELVERIKPFAAKTRIPEMIAGVGGFAGLCGLPTGMKEPVLVSGTDGVGSKLKIAFAADVHDTVGVDLVAMCVNDVITVGARPLFFLDYFATGKLDVTRAASVIRGIASGCEHAGCALLGGETAEMPGMYADGEYDLAGFCVGVVDRAEMLDGSKVREGDLLLGVASSGLHSHGYALVRRALLSVEERSAQALAAYVPELDDTLGAALLRPTRIYAKAVRAALATGHVHGIAHITGGGLPGNIPRVLPDDLGAEVRLGSFPRPPIFTLVQRAGDVDEAEMQKTFNLGIGLVMIIGKDASLPITQALRDAGETVFEIGRVMATPGAAFEDRVVFV